MHHAADMESTLFIMRQALDVDASLLSAALTTAVADVGGRFNCVAFALPVVRVMGAAGLARLAVQVAFTATSIDADLDG